MKHELVQTWHRIEQLHAKRYEGTFTFDMSARRRPGNPEAPNPDSPDDPATTT
jgi:hypothetical protein